MSENDKKYDNKIKIVAGSGCYSYVGFQGVPHQSISLREVGCLSRGTVQHEFMHALGFYHEQARPDAEDHINVKDLVRTTFKSGNQNQWRFKTQSVVVNIDLPAVNIYRFRQKKLKYW